MKTRILLCIYVLVLIIGFFNSSHIMSWLSDQDMTLLPFMFPLSVFIGLFPVIPFGLFAGIMGAKYGPIWGTFINWTGSFGSALLMFLYVRYGYQKKGREFLARFQQLDRFTSVFERSAFMAVLFARLIPIIPSPVITIYSAISMISVLSFALATAIGKIPTMLVYSFLGDQVFTDVRRTIITILVYASFIGIAYLIYRRWLSPSTKK